MTEAEDRPSSAPPAQEPPRSEEELRARIEEQIRSVRVQDLLLESVVSLLNLAARRIAKEDERDLEQARVGIEATRAVVDLLDPDQAKQVREGLAQVQMLYAREAGGGAEDAGEGPPGGEGGESQKPSSPRQARTQGRPSKLWTPPGV